MYMYKNQQLQLPLAATCAYGDGQSYSGIFKRGLKEGRGNLTFRNGADYEGRFRADAIDGQGGLSVTVPVPMDSQDNWLVPIQLKTDIAKIHLKAGFDEDGV